MANNLIVNQTEEVHLCDECKRPLPRQPTTCASCSLRIVFKYFQRNMHIIVKDFWNFWFTFHSDAMVFHRGCYTAIPSWILGAIVSCVYMLYEKKYNNPLEQLLLSLAHVFLGGITGGTMGFLVGVGSPIAIPTSFLAWFLCWIFNQRNDVWKLDRHGFIVKK